MKSPQQPISVIRVSVQACLLVLALSMPHVAHAQASSALAAVESDNAKTAKKLEMRLHAEKLRAIREERERQADKEAAELAARPATSPALRPLAHAPTAESAKRFLAKEAERAITAAVHHLGLSPKHGAGTAGFLLGVSGPWAYSKMLDASAAEGVVLDAITAGVADASTTYLADRYAGAEETGRMARYLALMLAAGGLLNALHTKFSRRSSRISRRTSRTGCESSGQSNKSNKTGIGMFKLFGRKSATPNEKQEPCQAVVVAFDMDTLRDYAYNLLFARGRHDLAGVGDMVTANFARCLQTHFQTLEAKGHWNKVERICALKCEEVESWQEAETSIAKLHVSWKALDYVVNYNRRPGEAGYVVDGDPTKMEDFYEEWVVTRRAGDVWQVDAMYPAERRSALARS